MQKTYSMSGVVWNFTYYYPHTCNCQYNKMMINHELLLKCQKLTRSNKHRLNIFWFLVHILHLRESKAILLIDDTILKKPSNFQTFTMDLQTLLLLFNISLSSSNLLFRLHSHKAATISGFSPQPQDNNWCNVEEHKRGFGVFLV